MFSNETVSVGLGTFLVVTHVLNILHRKASFSFVDLKFAPSSGSLWLYKKRTVSEMAWRMHRLRAVDLGEERGRGLSDGPVFQDTHSSQDVWEEQPRLAEPPTTCP